MEYNNNVSEPLELIGEGEYNINALKEIKVTDAYLGLDQETRGCQTKEPYFNCTTKQYIETIRSKCGCLPSNIQHTDEVLVKNFYVKTLLLLIVI